MKYKAKRAGMDGLQIIGKGTRAESIDYRDARYLNTEGSEVFLPFSYGTDWGLEFRYTANGMKSLDDLMRNSLDSRTFHDLLEAYLQLIKVCDRDGLKYERVYLERDKVFYHERTRRVGFMYVPIVSYVAPGMNLNEAIADLCEHATFASTMDKNIALTVADAVRRTKTISAEDFENLLASQGFLGAMGDKTAIRGLKPVTDAEAEAAAHAEIDAGYYAETQALGYSKENSPMRGAPFSLADNTGRFWPLPTGVSTVGRGTMCSIVVNQPGISRQHAQITWGGDGLKIRDLNSTNGVGVNGIRLSPGMDYTIGPDDAIELGGTQLKIVRSPR